MAERKPRADKGVKRGKYVLKARAERSKMRDLSNTLRQVERLERKEIAKRAEKKRTSHGGGRPRAERRREIREKLLPESRICPICGEVRLKSKQWVTSNSVIMCKSCHIKENKGKAYGNR
jgi:hypothetical protein